MTTQTTTTAVQQEPTLAERQAAWDALHAALARHNTAVSNWIAGQGARIAAREARALFGEALDRAQALGVDIASPRPDRSAVERWRVHRITYRTVKGPAHVYAHTKTEAAHRRKMLRNSKYVTWLGSTEPYQAIRYSDGTTEYTPIAQAKKEGSAS